MTSTQIPAPQNEQPSKTADARQPVAPRKRSRSRVLALIALLALAAFSAYLWVTYLTTHQPITQTIPVAQVAAQVIKPRYLFSIYGVAEPLGVAVSPDGSRIYVSESGGQRLIRVFDKDGKELAKFAPPGYTPGRSAPVSLSLDNQGRVFVADSLRQRVDIYDAGGNFKKTIEPPLKHGWVPVALQVDGQTVLVAGRNSVAEGIFAMTQDGQLQFQFGRHGEDGKGDGFNDPGKAVTDAQGRIYVTDGMNQRVAVFDKGRNFLYSLTGFNLPRGMAIDEDQKLYVVDTIDQMVKVFDAGSGDKPPHLFDFGDQGIGDGEFNYPNDIAFDGTGRLYITDRASNRVQVWTY